MVSSTRRAEACRAYLREAGLSEQQIARLHAPIGLDIGARTPAEIAASILAELIQERRHVSPQTSEAATGKDTTTEEISVSSVAHSDQATAIDPVCGMSVETTGARHTSSYAGSAYYFCCPACKRQFEREPERFLTENKA
jgi:xanthine dehydrogenase accessory factor